MKDVWWSDRPAEAGVFGGHVPTSAPTDASGTSAASGRGQDRLRGIIRQLNHTGYQGPLTVEWEDPGMDREHGATESAAFCKQLDFAGLAIAFDSAFARLIRERAR